jgi:hypothetical protein
VKYILAQSRQENKKYTTEITEDTEKINIFSVEALFFTVAP